jgi:hypothetical protein
MGWIPTRATRNPLKVPASRPTTSATSTAASVP